MFWRRLTRRILACRRGWYQARRSVVLAGLLLSLAAAAVAADAPPSKPPTKPSSFAPHHTAKRSFGAPVQKPILHKRTPKKQTPAEPKLRSSPLPDAPK